MKLLIAVLLLASSPALGDGPKGGSVDDLIDWLENKYASYRSIQIEVIEEMTMDAIEFTTKERSETTTQAERQDGKVRFRRESKPKRTWVCKKPGCALPPARPDKLSITIGVGDSVIEYTAGDSAASKRAPKASDADVLNAAAKLRELLKDKRVDLKRLPDQSLDGSPTYVLAVTPKKGSSSVKLYFAQSTGIALKTVTEGKLLSITTTVRTVVIDKPIGPERFKLPPNIRVKPE